MYLPLCISGLIVLIARVSGDLSINFIPFFFIKRVPQTLFVCLNG